MTTRPGWSVLVCSRSPPRLVARGDAEAANAKIEAMAGPSGFMLFATHNHGALRG
jgi:hypothetical protein